MRFGGSERDAFRVGAHPEDAAALFVDADQVANLGGDEDLVADDDRAGDADAGHGGHPDDIFGGVTGAVMDAAPDGGWIGGGKAAGAVPAPADRVFGGRFEIGGAKQRWRGWRRGLGGGSSRQSACAEKENAGDDG